MVNDTATEGFDLIDSPWVVGPRVCATLRSRAADVVDRTKKPEMKVIVVGCAWLARQHLEALDGVRVSPIFASVVEEHRTHMLHEEDPLQRNPLLCGRIDQSRDVGPGARYVDM